MRNFITTLFLLCSLALTHGATYYVSTTGNNSNPGTLAAPWLTVSNACLHVLPGDLVLVQPGIYTTLQRLVVAGADENPIIFRANGAVTNAGQWYLEQASHIVIDGFEWTGGGSYNNLPTSIYMAPSGVSDVQIINNYFHDPPGTWNCAVAVNAIGGADSIMISNNAFANWGSLQDALITSRGMDWLVTDNTITNTYGGDVFRAFGGRHTYRKNKVWFGSAHVNVYGAGNPAFNGIYMYNATLSAQWPDLWVHTNANGYLWISSADKPYGNYGLSNKISICSADRSITYASSSNSVWNSGVVMRNAAIISPPTGGSGYINHPDFVQCFNDKAPLATSTNMVFEQNYVENNIVGAVCQLTAVEPTWPMLIRDYTFRNNIFVGCRSSSVDIRSYWYNNLFFRCGDDATSISFATYSYTNSLYRGDASGSWVRNNMFIECSNGAFNKGWYSAAPYDSDIITNCNYNYVTRSATTWAPVRTSGTSTYYAFYEPNGINGGNPKIVNVNANIFKLMASSPLIDAGDNNIADLINDFDGWGRPKGAGVDIGPYEFDTNLLVHLDFDQGFASTNVVVDITGYGHNAWQGNPTSHITAVSGPRGAAGKWTQVGTMNNAPPNVYPLSQYLVITNLTGIEFITNGSISMWVQWAKYTNDYTGATRHATLIDSGGTTLQFANPPSMATNSWRLAYGPASSTLPAIGPVLSAYSESANWPSNFVQFTHARDEETWHHIVMTWEAGGNAIGYENGVPISTNPFPRLYLRVAGRDPANPPFNATDTIPWMAIGAASHGGSLTWGDDRYPNDGYFVGKMDDIRIYNRAVTPGEVQSLYSGASAVTTITEPPGDTAPVISVQPSSQTILDGGNATFTVVATGTAPLTYYWRKDGVVLVSSSSSSFTISLATISDAGNYSVIVSNAVGTATSANALLTVNAVIPSITVNLTNITAYVGGNVSFHVAAIGTTPFTYKWQKQLTLTTYQTIEGENNSSLTLVNIDNSAAGKYRCQVGNAAGSVYSSLSTLTVSPPLPPPSLQLHTSTNIFLLGNGVLLR